MKKLIITVAVIFLTFGISIHTQAQNPCDARIADGKLYIPCLYLPDETRIELKLEINDNLISGISDIGESTAAPVPVTKTGQTTCWNDRGNSIDCAGSGQDGDLQKGVALPNPRFTDNGNGTVTDNLTGLIWLKKTNCFGSRTWSDALNDCNTLATGACGLTDGSNAGDWHLPNRKELDSLINLGFSYPALSNTSGTGPWAEGDPFTGLYQSNSYWSSSAFAAFPLDAWLVHFSSGSAFLVITTATSYVWPVRAGQQVLWRSDASDALTSGAEGRCPPLPRAASIL